MNTNQLNQSTSSLYTIQSCHLKCFTLNHFLLANLTITYADTRTKKTISIIIVFVPYIHKLYICNSKGFQFFSSLVYHYTWDTSLLTSYSITPLSSSWTYYVNTSFSTACGASYQIILCITYLTTPTTFTAILCSFTPNIKTRPAVSYTHCSFRYHAETSALRTYYFHNSYFTFCYLPQ